MSAESDSVSSNSSLIISENSDGFTCSPLGSRHWHLKADVPAPMIRPGSNASSFGREIRWQRGGRFCILTILNIVGILMRLAKSGKIKGVLVNYGENPHKNQLPKHFIDPFGSLRKLQV